MLLSTGCNQRRSENRAPEQRSLANNCHVTNWNLLGSGARLSDLLLVAIVAAVALVALVGALALVASLALVAPVAAVSSVALVALVVAVASVALVAG